eukprot:3332157-Prymnesium_polylepis.2
MRALGTRARAHLARVEDCGQHPDEIAERAEPIVYGETDAKNQRVAHIPACRATHRNALRWRRVAQCHSAAKRGGRPSHHLSLE